MPKANSDPIPKKEQLQLWALQSGCSPSNALKKQEYAEAMFEAIRKRPVLKRWVLSIDIGYRNFSYCLMDNSDSQIVQWRNIELLDQAYPYPESYNVAVYCQAVTRLCQRHFAHLDISSLSVLVEEQQQHRKDYANSGRIPPMIPTIFKINVIEAMVHTWFQSALNVQAVSLSPSKMGRYQQCYMEAQGLITSQMTNKKKITAGFLSYIVEIREVTIISHFWEIYQSAQKKDDLADSLSNLIVYCRWIRKGEIVCKSIQNFININN